MSLDHDSGPGFNAKVRFSRDVEACLLSPELPPAPLLALRVRERVMSEALRRARRSEIRGLVAAAAAILAVSAAALIALGAPINEWLRRAQGLPPVAQFLKAVAVGLIHPLDVLSGLTGAAALTLLGVVLLIAFSMLSELFIDPLRGVSSGPHGL